MPELAAPPSDGPGAVAKREENGAKMAPRLMNNNSPWPTTLAPPPRGVLLNHQSRELGGPILVTKAANR